VAHSDLGASSAGRIDRASSPRSRRNTCTGSPRRRWTTWSPPWAPPPGARSPRSAACAGSSTVTSRSWPAGSSATWSSRPVLRRHHREAESEEPVVSWAVVVVTDVPATGDRDVAGVDIGDSEDGDLLEGLRAREARHLPSPPAPDRQGLGRRLLAAVPGPLPAQRSGQGARAKTQMAAACVGMTFRTFHEELVVGPLLAAAGMGPGDLAQTVAELGLDVSGRAPRPSFPPTELASGSRSPRKPRRCGGRRSGPGLG
jgi:hypothetical protein